MNDVPGGTGIFKKSCKPASAFGFDGLRTAGLVPLRPGLAFGDELRLKPRDQLSVFAVRSNDHAELLRERQCLIHFAVIDAKEIFVRQENFERRSAVRHNFAKLRFRFFAKFRDRHVKRVIASTFPVGLGFPEFIAGQRVVSAVRATHFDIGGRAANKRRDAGRFMRVLGESGHEGKVDMHVRIDEAGKNKFAGCVDDFGAGRHFKIFADARDRFVFDVDIGSCPGADGYDLPISDQQAHRILLRQF